MLLLFLMLLANLPIFTLSIFQRNQTRAQLLLIHYLLLLIRLSLLFSTLSQIALKETTNFRCYVPSLNNYLVANHCALSLIAYLKYFKELFCAPLGIEPNSPYSPRMLSSVAPCHTGHIFKKKRSDEVRGLEPTRYAITSCIVRHSHSTLHFCFQMFPIVGILIILHTPFQSICAPRLGTPSLTYPRKSKQAGRSFRRI